MKSKPGSAGARGSSERRTSTSATPRRNERKAATSSSGGSATPATGPRESWRSRTGAGSSSNRRFRPGGRRRPPTERPRRIPGVLNRPSIDDVQLREDFDQLLRCATDTGLALTDPEQAGLWTYGKFLVERAGTLNLISQVDRPRFFTRHMLECLVPGLVSHARRSRELVDIGSGGGLPGLPLALVAPDLRVTLVEPRQRKVQFLEAVVMECGLSERVRVFQGTAEKFAEGLHGEPVADLATARAVDRLEKVWGWARRLLVPGGWLATYKGPAEMGEELERLDEEAPAAMEAYPCVGQPRAVLLIQVRAS